MTTPDNHNEVSSRFSGMFNDFLTAAKAMEALPTLEAKIRDAEAERDTVKAEASFHRDRVTELGDQITALQAKIAELEASLDKATKSEAASKEALGFLLDAAKSAMKTVEETVELVSPHPIADAVGSQQDPHVNPMNTGTPQLAGVISSEGQSEADPTQPATATEPAASATPGTTEGQSEPLPYLQATTPPPSSETTVTGSGPDLPTASSGASGPLGQEAAIPDSALGPFASSTDATPTPAPQGAGTVETGSPAQQSAAVSPPSASLSRPFVGQPHWHKPNDMSWDNWIAKGGDTPPWLAAKQA